MERDNQQIIDIISSVSKDIYRFSEEICEFVDSIFERSALPLREALNEAQWWPDTLRRTTHSEQRIVKPPIASTGLWSWIKRHELLSAAAIAFVFSSFGMAVWTLRDYRRKHYMRKRRARRGLDRSKLDVVVVAGIPDMPLPRSIILDLERRGFIVYVVVTNPSDEKLVRDEKNADIIPFNLNITSKVEVRNTMQYFTQLLQNARSLEATGALEYMHLVGVVIVPDLTCPLGPIEVIDPERWSDTFHAKLLKNIAIVQAFLPLVRASQSRILFLTPSITSFLRPCFHGVETTVTKALETYVDTLASEMGPTTASISHLKMGEFDYDIPKPLEQQQDENEEVTVWSSTARKVYGKKSLAQAKIASSISQSRKGVKGSPLRELNNAVFDILTQERPSRMVHIGRGSLLYDLLAQWLPPCFIRWALSRQCSSFSDNLARISPMTSNLTLVDHDSERRKS